MSNKNTLPKEKETVTKEVAANEVNNAPETSKAVADIHNTPTVQAQVGSEAYVGPIQPEAPSASDVAEELNVDEPTAPIESDKKIEGLHTISKADLERHPELSEQNVKVGDQIKHESKQVYKYPTADRSSIVAENWPRKVTADRVNV